MPARTLFRRIDLDALWGVSSTLPVATINGDGWPSAHTDRSQRRTLAAAGEALATLRALKIAGQAHVNALSVEANGPEPTIIDAVVDIRVDLVGDLVLHVMPHHAGGTAAAFFEGTPQRCWVIDLDDTSAAATTLLAMTAERVGNAAWAAEHGVKARAVRLLPTAGTQWQLGLQTDNGYVVSEPNGELVAQPAGRSARRGGAPTRAALARTAADLTRDAAALLAAA